MIEHKDKHGNENMIEGRNAVLEAFRSGKPVDKLFVLDGCQDGPVRTIVREAKKHDTLVQFVDKERLTQLSQTGRHQGVIAYTAAYEYAQVEDMLALAKERERIHFLFCWTILKTHTTWVRLSVLQIWQVRMESLFLNEER